MSEVARNLEREAENRSVPGGFRAILGLDFGLLGCKTVIQGHLVCGTLLQEPQETNTCVCTFYSTSWRGCQRRCASAQSGSKSIDALLVPILPTLCLSAVLAISDRNI